MSPLAPTLEDPTAPLAAPAEGLSSGMPARAQPGPLDPGTGRGQRADAEGLSTAASLRGTPDLAPSSSFKDAATVNSGCEASSCTLARAEASEPLLPEAQRRWAARPLVERLQVIRQARHWMAAHPEIFARALSPNLARVEADTLVSELMPLLAAMRFLERSAGRILASRRLGSAGRPLWLAGVQAEIRREPLGHVLVIGPANFPLFLPGVQVLQALVAGNAATWKPGTGGQKVAILLTRVLREAGLPRGVLHITGETIEDAQQALASHPDKVVFTGSLEAGRHILGTLAPTGTPSTMELSGADAVVVLPSADLNGVAKAVAFGLRLNGGEVCMSPRRLIATRDTLRALRPLLQAELGAVPAVPVKPRTAELLSELLTNALQSGAKLLELKSSPLPSPLVQASGTAPPDEMRPLVIDHASPQMPVTHSDIFAPVLSLLEAPSVLHMADLVNSNPYGLTAAIFGNTREAETLAGELRVGTVVINDLIAPTADPRLPFGGRGSSGFGLTRGTEGLLEMTAAKTVLRRNRLTTVHYDPLGKADLPLFAGLIGFLYGGSLKQRWASLKQVMAAGRERSRRGKTAQTLGSAAHREKRA